MYRWFSSLFRSKAPETIGDEAADAIMLTDPERFLAIVRNDDPEFRIANLHTSADVVASVLLRCGFDRDAATSPRVREMYEEIVKPVPLEPRLESVIRLQNEPVAASGSRWVQTKRASG